MSSANPLVFAVATAGTLAAIEVGAWSARDALFLTQHPPETLPLAMMGQGALSIAATFALSAWLRRAGPTVVAPAALTIFGVLFGVLAFSLAPAPEATTAALYLLVSALGPLVVSTFWSVVNERFDPHSARQAVSRMTAAGALGGVAGGIAAERCATLMGFPALLSALGALCIVCAIGVARVGVRSQPPEAETEEERGDSGLRQVTQRPLLRQMALLMFTVAIVETLVDYVLKIEAAAAFPRGEDLVRFFAAFYTGCWLLSFVLQSTLGDRTLKRFGLAGAVALLPGSVAIAGTIGAVTAKLWAFALVRGAETVASVSFFRTGFQLLYTPLPPNVKRPAKAWVDVASGSMGDLLGAALVLGLLSAIPGLPNRVVVLVAVVLCVPALLLVRRIHSGYVAQLASSLRSGRMALRPQDALDATTARTIAETRVGHDRQSLLERARAFHEQTEQQAEAPQDPAPDEDAAPREGADENAAAEGPESPLPGWVETVLAGRPDDVRRLLQRELSSGEASMLQKRQVAPHVIPLLADPRLAREAEQLLRSIAPKIIGLLTDTLLDDEAKLATRTRAAALLARVPGTRAMAGLWHGLDADAFAVRVACARAAVRVVGREASLRPDREAVENRVARELSASDAQWKQMGGREESRDDLSVLLQRRALTRVHPALEHVFTLLALSHEREVMASVLGGITSDDAHVRGTGLEYLETVLSPRLRTALWPRLATDVARTTSDRSRQQIAEELLRSSADLVADAETPS